MNNPLEKATQRVDAAIRAVAAVSDSTGVKAVRELVEALVALNAWSLSPAVEDYKNRERIAEIATLNVLRAHLGADDSR